MRTTSTFTAGKIIFALVILPACLSCAAAPPVRTAASEAAPPAWTRATPRAGDGYVFYVGSSADRDSSETAGQAAVAAALAQISQEAGAEIVSSLKVEGEAHEKSAGAYLGLAIPPNPWTGLGIQGKVGGEYKVFQSNYDFEMKVSATGKQVQVQGVRVLARYDETWHRNGKTALDSWVLIGLPEREHERLLRKMQESTLLAIRCRPADFDYCYQVAEPAVTAAAREAGIALTPNAVKAQLGEDLLALARERKADQVLEVTVVVDYQGEMDGEHFAYGSGSFRLFDAESGNTLRAGEVAKRKEGHVSKDKVSGRAVDGVVAELAGKIREGK